MMQQYIEPQFRAALGALGVDFDGAIQFSVPRQEGHGHLATNLSVQTKTFGLKRSFCCASMD